MEIIRIDENIVVPDSAIEFRYSRSGGKGGQNVNKVSTKVELLLDLALIECSDEIKKQLFRRLSSRIDSLHKIHIVSQESRSQLRNKQNSYKKMIELLLDASKVKEKRISTKKGRSVKNKEIDLKKKKKLLKSLRRRVSADVD